MSDFVGALLDSPLAALSAPFAAGFRLTRDDLDTIHIHSVRRLFSELRPRVAALDRLATELKINEIRTLDDVVPLLFPHAIFKSYSLSFVEEGRFDTLTQWLGMLSGTNLSGVDCAGIGSLDDWIDRLDRQTDLRVVHTFGTTGKLSLLPRLRSEWVYGAQFIASYLRGWRPEGGPDLLKNRRPVVVPHYFRGASGAARVVQTVGELFAGSADDVLCLYPNERFSADVAALAGRLRAAEQRGDREQLELSPAMQARREEFARQDRERPERLRQFFAEVVQRCSGRDVYLFSVWPVLSEWAEEGLSRGIRSVFGPGTILHTGGGTKGRKLPERWRERVFEFLGVESCHEFYGMTEIISAMPRCEAGNYHVPPVIVPFVIDAGTGEAFPREGRQTGRFAAVDLLARSYWAGIVTGDEVTLAGWDRACDCGRSGPYVEPDIRRAHVLDSSDDKVNCGGVQEVHDDAVAYLANRMW